MLGRTSIFIKQSSCLEIELEGKTDRAVTPRLKVLLSIVIYCSESTSFAVIQVPVCICFTARSSNWTWNRSCGWWGAVWGYPILHQKVSLALKQRNVAWFIALKQRMISRFRHHNEKTHVPLYRFFFYCNFEQNFNCKRFLFKEETCGQLCLLYVRTRPLYSAYISM